MLNRVNMNMKQNPNACSTCASKGSTKQKLNGTDGNTVGNLTRELQKLDFSIVELVLYLDAYPNCKKALDYYKKLTAQREKVAEQLAMSGKPTNPLCNKGEGWNWTQAPWPWEYDANL